MTMIMNVNLNPVRCRIWSHPKLATAAMRHGIHSDTTLNKPLSDGSRTTLRMYSSVVLYVIVSVALLRTNRVKMRAKDFVDGALGMCVYFAVFLEAC